MTGQNTDFPIEVTGRHAPISDRMKEHALEKLERLTKYHPKITGIKLVADEPHDAPEVEIIVSIDGGEPFVAKDHADTFGNAVDLCMNKMSKQLRRSNSRRKDHGHESIKDLPLASDSTETEERFDDPLEP